MTINPKNRGGQREPWQYSLASLILFTTVCAVVLSVTKTVPHIWEFLLIILLGGVGFGIFIAACYGVIFGLSWLAINSLRLIMEVFDRRLQQTPSRRSLESPPPEFEPEAISDESH
jgi:hypothetical protein